MKAALIWGLSFAAVAHAKRAYDPQLTPCFVFQRNALSAADAACLEGALVASENACLKSLALNQAQLDTLAESYRAFSNAYKALEDAYRRADATFSKGTTSLAQRRWSDAYDDFSQSQVEASSAAGKGAACLRGFEALMRVLRGPLTQELLYRSVRVECRRNAFASYPSVASYRSAAEHAREGCNAYWNMAQRLVSSAASEAALAEQSGRNEQEDERRRRDDEERHRNE